MLTDSVLKRVLDPQVFAFETGKTFRGLTISPNGANFNIIVRGYERDGGAIYAMSRHQDPLEGLTGLLDALCARGGEALWRHDRYFVG